MPITTYVMEVGTIIETIVNNKEKDKIKGS
jgi:hypothetical protein